MTEQENLQAVRQIIDRLEQAEYFLGGKKYGLSNKIEELRDKRNEAEDRVAILNEGIHTVEGGHFIFTGTFAEINEQLKSRENDCLQARLTIDEEINRIREKNSDYTNGNIRQMVRGKAIDMQTQLEGDKEVQRQRQEELALARRNLNSLRRETTEIQTEVQAYKDEIDFSIEELNKLISLREEVNTALTDLKAALEDDKSNICMDSEICKEALDTLSIAEEVIGNVTKDTPELEGQFDELIQDTEKVEEIGQQTLDALDTFNTIAREESYSIGADEQQRIQNMLDIDTLKHPVLSALADIKTAKVRIEDARDRLSMQGIEYQSGISKVFKTAATIATATYDAVFSPIGRGTISLAKGMASGLKEGWKQVCELTNKTIESLSKAVSKAKHDMKFAAYGAFDLMTLGGTYQLAVAADKYDKYIQNTPYNPIRDEIWNKSKQIGAILVGGNLDMDILKEAHEATWGGLNSPIDKGVAFTVEAYKQALDKVEPKLGEMKTASAEFAKDVKHRCKEYGIDLCHNLSNIAEKQALATLDAMKALIDQTNSALELNLKAENYADRQNGQIIFREPSEQNVNVKNLFPAASLIATQTKGLNKLIDFCYKDVQKSLKVGQELYDKNSTQIIALAKRAATWSQISNFFLKGENSLSKMKHTKDAQENLGQDDVAFERG